MYDRFDEDVWLIWNTALGLLTTVTLGEVEAGPDGRSAWLDEPFDMVGPFSLDELEENGRIEFAACIVMSRQRWQQDQAGLRQASAKVQRAEQARAEETFSRYSQESRDEQIPRKPFNERQHRKTLHLPLDGKLDIRQIKAAFRRLAQKVHPDMGGSNEQFVLITAARDALLERT